MTQEIIRAYLPPDQFALLDIFKLYIPSDFAPGELDDFESHLKEHGDTYFSFEIKGRIIGGIGYQLKAKDSVGQIKWILIHPDYSGKGFGKVAIEHCLTIFKSNPSITKAMVTTSQLAYRFFEKFGFVLKKTENDFWSKGLHLYLLEREMQH